MILRSPGLADDSSPRLVAHVSLTYVSGKTGATLKHSIKRFLRGDSGATQRLLASCLCYFNTRVPPSIGNLLIYRSDILFIVHLFQQQTQASGLKTDSQMDTFAIATIDPKYDKPIKLSTLTILSSDKMYHDQFQDLLTFYALRICVLRQTA